MMKSEFLKTYFGLKIFTLSFLIGAVSVLSLAPFHYPIFFLIGFSCFLALLEHTTTKKQAFIAGWAYGFGYFTFGLYWIANALFVDIGKWWWLVPFTVIGLPFALSFFWGVAGILSAYFRKTPLSLSLAASALFGGFEYLRGVLFTGFPWNLPAYIWMESPISQSLSLFGAYGLTLLTFMIGCLFYLTYHGIKNRSDALRGSALICLVIFCTLFAFGYTTLQKDIPQADVRDIKLAIIQPNIAQKDKWKREKQWENFNTLTELTAEAQQENPDLIIWPETAITFAKPNLNTVQSQLSEALKPHQTLISGIIDIEQTDDQPDKYFNSLIVLDSQARLQTQYNKHHLVPFGEYVPFRKLLSFGPVAQALSTTGDFSAGDSLKTLHTINTSFSPLICYEIIFPGKTVAKQYARPEFLLNLTNDAWYGDTTGPRQHLAMTRARAIETGLPAVRVAGTGISAIIDPYGRLLEVIPLGAKDYATHKIPQSLERTVFFNVGNIPFFTLIVIFIGIASSRRKKSL